MAINAVHLNFIKYAILIKKKKKRKKGKKAFLTLKRLSVSSPYLEMIVNSKPKLISSQPYFP